MVTAGLAVAGFAAAGISAIIFRSVGRYSGYAASSWPCVHNRARLYHVHHKALYRAVGDPDSRFRRAISARAVRGRRVLAFNSGSRCAVRSAIATVCRIVASAL